MTKTKKTIFGLMAVIIMALPIFVMPTITDAQFKPDPGRSKELGVSETGNANLIEVIFTVIKGLLKVVFAIAVLMFIVSGIFFLTSAGTERANTARDILTYAIIGLVVSVLGYAIVLFLSNSLVGNDTGTNNVTITL